jgi:ABC-type branched-subunit amino acid transport system substrate-binding protein
LALGAGAQSALSPQERRGKQIYLKGEVEGGGEIKAYLSDGDLELSAKAFPCANCHGLKGQGLKEGGLQPPSIKAANENESRTARLAVIYAKGDFSADAVEGLKTQAKMHSMEIVSEIGYGVGAFRVASAVEEIASKKSDYVFFFGASGDILSFAREMEKAKLNATLLSSLVMLGRAAFELPAGVASRTLLAYPAPLPREEELSDFNALMRKANVASRHPAMQRAAYAAARVFVEAMKSSGRQTSRAGLISSIEKLRDFRTGVLPPLTFGPNNRVGATGSYVVGIDPDKTRIVPLSEWLAPKERP